MGRDEARQNEVNDEARNMRMGDAKRICNERIRNDIARTLAVRHSMREN